MTGKKKLCKKLTCIFTVQTDYTCARKAVLIAAVLVLGMSSIAFADPADEPAAEEPAAPSWGSITINNAIDGHTYTAYQIFSCDFADGVLSNIAWGNGITDAGKRTLQSKDDETY